MLSASDDMIGELGSGACFVGARKLDDDLFVRGLDSFCGVESCPVAQVEKTITTGPVMAEVVMNTQARAKRSQKEQVTSVNPQDQNKYGS